MTVCNTKQKAQKLSPNEILRFFNLYTLDFRLIYFQIFQQLGKPLYKCGVQTGHFVIFFKTQNRGPSN